MPNLPTTRTALPAARTAELYRRAKQIIPGGTHLLSKRPELYAPELWPAYFSRAKGVDIWDLDGVRYTDFSCMGMGACLLGYGCEAVDEAVIQRIRSGSVSSLNVAEEVQLAEKLLELHPWADHARFTRSGGEAMAVAVRVARAATRRSIVVVCGYHGWSDWYLAANLRPGDALGGHLLPGLAPLGVPRELTGTTLTFRYNRIDELAAVVADQGEKIAAIVMEPMRLVPPKDNFLARVRELADQAGAVLIFDEITTGWRFCMGGVHALLGEEPDLVVYAKAIANGYPMGAILGREEIMSAAEQSFISSTSWTEGTGPVAALATLAELDKVQPWPIIEAAGKRVLGAWAELGAKYGLPVTVAGPGALSSLSFDLGGDTNAARTLFVQEMLARNILGSSSFYPSAAHTDAHIDHYLETCEHVFGLIARVRASGGCRQALKHREADEGFRRLT